jgi:hypothetical protein
MGRGFRFIKWSTLVLLIVFVFLACSKNEKEFTLGSQFLESQSNIYRTDTFSVELSTVLIDSFPSSNFGKLMAGSVVDNLFGGVTCKSFFKIGLPSYPDVEVNDVFDSVRFILNFTGYCYGDTTAPVSLSLHKLKNKIVAYDNGNLYNTSSIPYEEEPFSTINFTPTPNLVDSIAMHLSNAFGLDLFNKLLTNSDTLASDQNFELYLKGFALVSDENAKSILEFDASAGHPTLRIYYHRNGQTLVNLTVDFPLIYPALQFNQIKHDFKNTNLNSLQNQRDAVLSGQLQNRAFIYGGVGLMTRVRFPSLPEFLLFKNCFALKAELVFYPQKGSYSNYPLPTQVMMYNTDKFNHLGSIYYNSNGTVRTAILAEDKLYNEQTYYTMNISDYIINELADSYFDTDHGLLISTLPSNFVNKFERLIIEGKNPALKLRLYYVSY